MEQERMTEEEIEATRERLRNYVKDMDCFENIKPEIDMKDRKSNVLSQIKEYLAKSLPAKSQKRNAEFIRKVSVSTTQQIRFGKSPAFEKGYLYGNVSAKGWNSLGDTEYYRTISVDLQTPEYVFFNGYADYSTCVAAANYMDSLKNNIAHKVDKYGIRKNTLFWCEREVEALNYYAEQVCGEQFGRIDYQLTDTCVNEGTYVQTEELQTCNFYPVYISIADSKGKSTETFVGYYNAEKDLMFYEIKFPTPSQTKKLWLAGLAIAAIVVIILIATAK